MSVYGKINGKRCVLENAAYSWLLHVDGETISFNGSLGADYFQKHYESLGYDVERIKTHKYIDESSVTYDPNYQCQIKRVFGEHSINAMQSKCIECGISREQIAKEES